MAHANQSSARELKEGSAFHKHPFVDLNKMAPKYPSSEVDARTLNEGHAMDMERRCWAKNPSRFGSYLPKRL
jgi:hypothetical protein